MAKVIDITDRLDFDENPVIKVRGVELEVNADAATMLKVMGLLSEKDAPGIKEVLTEKRRGRESKGWASASRTSRS